MAELFFYRLQDDGFEWLRYNGQGQLAVHGEGDESALRDAALEVDCERVLIVPGDQVLLTTANVPSKNARQIAQAVPYVIEEQIAADIEDSFFALGERNSEGDVPVAVIDLALMESWVEKLKALELETTRVVAEFSLLSANEATAVVDGDQMHVNLPGMAATLPLADLPLVVSLLPEPLEHLQLVVHENSESEIQLVASELSASDIEVSVRTTAHAALLELCAGFGGTEINLLQGPYRVERKRKRSQSGWLSVAVLGGVAVFLHLLLQFGQGYYLSTRASGFEQQAMTLYQSIFPKDRNIRDLRRRWNNHLGKSGSGGGDFVPLFAQSARGLDAAGLTLNNVNFNESRGDLILQVLADQSDALVRYAQQLSNQGLEAEIGTITQEEDGVRGSIRVRQPGGAS